MSGEHILRVRRTDQSGDDAYVLINVRHNGSSPLDLELIGTDGEAPFVQRLKHKSVQSLRAKNYDGPEAEWRDTLSALLLQDRKHDSSHLELVATTGEQITLIVRKNISGITQRLGEIKLDQDEEQEVQLFEWTGLAAAGADELRNELDGLQAAVKAHQGTVEKLTAQLDDLVRAKKEHENELLQKFAELLNTKKLKIRDQQRLLATAKIDPKAAADVESTRASTGRRKVGASRQSKRKANGTAMDVEDEQEDRVGMENDDALDDEDEEMGKQMRDAATPEKSNLDETEDGESESDEEGFAPAPTASQAAKSGAGGKGKAIEMVKSREKTPESEHKSKDEAKVPPPRRELPFGRAKAQRQASPPKRAPSPPKTRSQDVAGDDEDTDDEL